MAFKSIYVAFILFFIEPFTGVTSSEKGFPKKYLELDEKPTVNDLDIYIDKLERLTNYLLLSANVTDSSQQMGNYFMSALLRRTLLDYNQKLGGDCVRKIKMLIKSSETITAHYTYIFKKSTNIRYKLQAYSRRDTISTFTYSIGKFNRNILPKFILNNVTINAYVQNMDDLILPKEKYAMLTERYQDPQYFITGKDSDECFNRMMFNIIPTDPTASRQPCIPNVMCKDRLFRVPSISYSLSHRQLNAMLYMNAMRCYFYSEGDDFANIHKICAEMYRESVYIARRGFFARDLFLEHTGLCSMMGYEEFHRRKWFLKAASWINEAGCVAEFPNFSINRTITRLSMIQNKKKAKKERVWLENLLMEQCHGHVMAVSMMVLANGVRHAAHYF